MKVLEHLGLQEEARYLLRTMSEEERESFRDRILSDASAFDLVREAENELCDAYARHELPPDSRRAFERWVLSNSYHQVRVARVLASRWRRTVAWRLVAAATLAVVVFGAALLLRPPSSPALAVFTLQPTTRAASAIPTLTAPRGGEVELRAPVTKPGSYRVELRTARGLAVRVWNAVTATETEIRARIESAALSEGAYELAVIENGSPVGYYNFRVVKTPQ